MERKQLDAGNQLFCDYFEDWIELYKKGAVRRVTYEKYLLAHRRIVDIAPDVKIKELDRRVWQGIINKFAEKHSKQTTYDFNTLIKAPILDAVDEGILPYNPAKKIVVKDGVAQQARKQKCLNVAECKKLSAKIDLTQPIQSETVSPHSQGLFYKVNWDWLIFLCLKTGLRFSEALGITPNDFDFKNNLLNVNKTFDYKYKNELVNETKTSSSIRKIIVDDKTAALFAHAVKNMNANEPIFARTNQRTYPSTPGNRLSKLCDKAGTPRISLHGLRHTHASLLFYSGASVHSISRRLGHADVSITQNTYLHLIKEMESLDNDKMLAGMKWIDTLNV